MLWLTDNRKLIDILPKKEAKAVEKQWGFTTVAELLSHHPRLYARQGQGIAPTDICEGDYISCMGEIVRSVVVGTSRGDMLKVAVRSGGTYITAVFFNPRYLAQQLVVGSEVLLNGKIRFFTGQPQLQQPDFLVLSSPVPNRRLVGSSGLIQLKSYGDEHTILRLLQSFDYLPIYPGKKGFASWRMLAAVHYVLAKVKPIPEPLGDFKPAFLPSFDAAIRGIHQAQLGDPKIFEQRFAYDEALALALILQLRRLAAVARQAPQLPPHPDGKAAKLVSRLPYELTAGQKHVIEDISADLSGNHPMQRLLQGEVGSGKTIVALIAMLQAIDNGKQCALLVPTEVLAHQHGRSLTELLADAGIDGEVVVLTGSATVKAKKEALLKIISGDAHIVVGTHTLIQDSVEFFDLGLCVIDEQHRFGVEQRDALRNKGKEGLTPHLLVMTATPIPRTVAMTFFADLNHSVLKELPGGRRPIASWVVPDRLPKYNKRALEVIREEVAQGHQAYIVCPRIEKEGGVEDIYQKLAAGYFADLRVAKLHGQLPPREKDHIMQQFAAGEIDVLVSTTVIEVGIDVANATVMFIREAECFGMSQLHQLRGRVGRGGNMSTCFFHYLAQEGSPTEQRITQMANTTDGFEVAELDLANRREGNVLGADQSGRSEKLQFLNLLDHGDVIELANKDATRIIEQDITLARSLVSRYDERSQEFIDKT